MHVRLSIALALLAATPYALDGPAPPRSDGRFVVRPHAIDAWLERGLSLDAARALRARAGAAIGAFVERGWPEVDEWRVRTPAGFSERDWQAALRATGLFEYVEVDWLVSAAQLPDDPLASDQWHLRRIGAPQAWNTTTGDEAVVVAVCDSGIDLDHPDFVERLVPGYNAVDDLAQVDGGAVDGLTDHGTEVAGVLGATGDNGVGVTGIGWSFSVMPIRVSNQANDTAFISDINAGARWAADHGADVVNASFSNVTNETVATTGAYVRAQGGVYVWAAGNAGASLGSFDSPDVLVVSATDRADDLADFSNRGAAIDVAAPGVDLWTTQLGDWGTNSGTSFAAPVVSGVLGLIRSVDPTLSAAAIEAILLVTAFDVGGDGEDDSFGHGRVDARRAVELAEAAAAGDVPPLAFDDEAMGGAGEALVVDVLANDVDLDGDPIAVVAFDGATASGGQVSATGDALLYTPPADFEGEDSFGYVLDPAGGRRSRAEVAVRVAKFPTFAAPVIHESPLTFGSPNELLAVDVDGDGDLDLASGSTISTSSLVFLANDGDGGFAPAGDLGVGLIGPADVELASLDADGCADLVWVDSFQDEIGVALGGCDFQFSSVAPIPLEFPVAVTAQDEAGRALDLDQDGATDLAVAQGGFPRAVWSYLGDGAGGFTPVSSVDVTDVPKAVRAADLDGDGDADVATAGFGIGLLRVFENDGSGVLSDGGATPFGAGISDLVLRDVDLDGDLDAVGASQGLLGQTTGLLVLDNDGTGAFTAGEVLDAGGASPKGVDAADLDADGDLDFVSANLLSNDVSLYPSIGPGGLGSLATSLPTTTGAHDVVLADLDRDGDLDLAVAVVPLFGGKRVLVFENLLVP